MEEQGALEDEEETPLEREQQKGRPGPGCGTAYWESRVLPQTYPGHREVTPGKRRKTDRVLVEIVHHLHRKG